MQITKKQQNSILEAIEKADLTAFELSRNNYHEFEVWIDDLDLIVKLTVSTTNVSFKEYSSTYDNDYSNERHGDPYLHTMVIEDYENDLQLTYSNKFHNKVEDVIERVLNYEL